MAKTSWYCQQGCLASNILVFCVFSAIPRLKCLLWVSVPVFSFIWTDWSQFELLADFRSYPITYGLFFQIFDQFWQFWQFSRLLSIILDYSRLLSITLDYSWLLSITLDYSRLLSTTLDYSFDRSRLFFCWHIRYLMVFDIFSIVLPVLITLRFLWRKASERDC